VTSVLEGPFLAACGLLIGAGADKVLRPESTSRALSAVGLPARRWLVRSAAFVELAIATAAAVTGGSVFAAAVALSYVGFAAFITLALVRKWPLSSCGCFGQVDTPPTSGHVVVNLAAAAVAAGAATSAAGGGTSLSGALRGQPVLGLPLIVLSGAVTALLFLLITGSARLGAIRRTGAGGAT
jgi:hypothetical protein